MGAPGSAAGSVPRPQAALMVLYILLLPVQVRAAVPALRLAPSDLLLVAGLLVWVFRRRPPLPRDAISVWHVALLAVFAMGTLVTLLHTGGIPRYVLLNKDAGLVILMSAYVWLAAHLDGWGRVRWALRVFVAAAAIATALGLIDYAAGRLELFRIPLMNTHPRRLTGPLVDPNAFGGLLVAAVAVLIPRGGDVPLLARRVRIAVLALLGLGIGLTFSRSAWIALMAVLGIAAVMDRRLRIAGVALVLTAAAALLLLAGTDSLSFAVEQATRAHSIDMRLDYMRVGLREFATAPILGVGLGYFAAEHNWIIHNTPLWILAEMGVVGLIAATGFLLWLLRRGIDAWRTAPPEQRPIVLGLLLAFAGMAALSLGVEALYQRHWWLVMAGLVASARAARVTAARAA